MSLTVCAYCGESEGTPAYDDSDALALGCARCRPSSLLDEPRILRIVWPKFLGVIRSISPDDHLGAVDA
jgi:hypothetical protein